MSGTNPTDQEAEPVNKVFECEPEQNMCKHVIVRKYISLFNLIAITLECCFNDQHIHKANNDFLQRRCRTKEQGVEEKHNDQVGSRTQRVTLKELPMTKPTPLL